MVVRKELELLQKRGELLDTKVGENTAIDIEDGGFRLAGDFFHFLKESRVGADFPAFIFYADFMEFRFCGLAPRAALFDVKNGGHDS